MTVSTVFQTNVIKAFGGLYLLWFAFRSARSAWSSDNAVVGAVAYDQSSARLYLNGALLHLTNPKAILVWMSIVALSSNQAGVVQHNPIPGCAAIGVVVFGGYAMLFSTEPARRFYSRSYRAMNALLAVAFGAAGLRLLAARP
ncbi:hypothetical protein ATN79_47360 [Paraburkholderia caribensis]|nr:hypothetical protein ATN79_47360 [Paraburkholderia caribensis]